MTAAILVEGLAHDYGRGPALAIPRLELGPGAVHLAGPNGAGKSTLLAVLATLLTPTRGRVLVAGHDTRREGARVRSAIGYAGHVPSLHPELTTAQNVAFAARLHGRPALAAREALAAWGLERHAHDRVRELSFGQARLVDLARAMVHAPPVLLLDEPASGLDGEARAMLAANVAATGARLLLVASHGDAGIPTRERITLVAGRLAEVSP